MFGARPTPGTLAATAHFRNSGDGPQTFTVYATADGADDRGDGIPLRSGTLPYGVSAGSPAIATVDLLGDDQQQSSVSFIASKGAAVVDGSRAAKVELDGPTERTDIIPIYVTHIGGASADDHSGLPASVRFTSNDWSAKLAVTVTGNCVDDDGESLTLAFHSLPFGVSAGRRVGAAVSILKKQ